MADDDWALWERYRQSRDMVARERLLEKNLPLVYFVVDRMALAAGPVGLSTEDLVGAGILGLIDALEKYNHRLGKKFSTYAFFRIRGAVLDEVRALDWVPRSIRQKNRQLEKAFETVARKRTRTPTEEDLAKHLGLSLEEYHDLLTETLVPPVVSLEELLDHPDHRADILPAYHAVLSRNQPDALHAVSVQEWRDLLAELIEKLPEKQRLVLTLYYYEELSMKEIAAVLDVTESRVCQIHSQAITHLRAGMKSLRQDRIRL